MQSLFLCSKYKIRDNIVTANETYSCVFSCAVGLFIIIFSHLYSLFQDSTFGIRVKGMLSFLIYLGAIGNMVCCVTGFILNYYTSWLHRHDNVFLLLKIQNAFKNLQIDSRKFKSLVVALNCYHYFWLGYFCCIFEAFRWWDIINSYVAILFDVNCIYMTRLLHLLTQYLKEWMKLLNRPGSIEESDDEAYSIRVFNVFMDILDAYQLLKKTYEVLVSRIDRISIVFHPGGIEL